MCDCVDLEYVGKLGREVRWTDWVTVVPDDDDPHTSGDVVSAEMVFTCAVRKPGSTGNVLEVVLIERTAGEAVLVKPSLNLILYRVSQSVAPQNSPYVAPSDVSVIIGRIEIKNADWNDLDAVTAIARIVLSQEIKAAAGTTGIYGVLTTPDTPEWTDAESQSLHLQLRIRRD